MTSLLYTIIDEMDIFFDSRYGNSSDYASEPPHLIQRRWGSGIVTLEKGNGGLKPKEFFSTDPKDFINKYNNISYSADR